MTYDFFGTNKPPQGWECPRCHKIWAPHIPSCGCHQTINVNISSAQWVDFCPHCGAANTWITERKVNEKRSCQKCGKGY